MGSIPFRAPLFKPGGDRIADLILARGQAQANAALRSGDIQAQAAARSGEMWSNTINQLGQVASGAIQQHAERAEQTKRSKAFDALFSGDTRPTLPALVKVLGPKDGPLVWKAMEAITPDPAKKNRDRSERIRDTARGIMALPPDKQAGGYTLGRNALISDGVATPEDVPEAFDPNYVLQAASYGVEPEKPKAPEKPPNLQHVETAKGIRAFDPTVGTLGPVLDQGRAPAPSQPAFQSKEVLNDEGKAVMANFDARSGRYVDVSTGQAIRNPRPVPNAPQNQRLTKEERQDFAAWNYALPKLDKFIGYVKANPDKWGKWDAMRQSLKQAMPGFSDAEYASQEAFIARINSEIRHALYGQALTGGEQQSAEGFIVNMTDQPERIIAKVNEAAERARSNVDYYRQLGFNLPVNDGGGAPTGAPPPPAGVTAEPTATGPNGQKLVLRNGQWVPLK